MSIMYSYGFLAWVSSLRKRGLTSVWLEFCPMKIFLLFLMWVIMRGISKECGWIKVDFHIWGTNIPEIKSFIPRFRKCSCWSTMSTFRLKSERLQPRFYKNNSLVEWRSYFSSETVFRKASRKSSERWYKIIAGTLK